MKSLFKPITGMFNKKNDDSSNASDNGDADSASKKEVTTDDNELAKQHCKLFTAMSEVKTKLEKLEAARGQITEERFKALHEQYSGFIEKNTPVLEKIRKEIDNRIASYLADKKDSAHRFAEIKKIIVQEAKLLEAGVISKDDYVEKIKLLKPEEKECGEKYKLAKKKIDFFKDAKNNKYVEPEPDPEESVDKDSEPTSEKGKNKGGTEKATNGKDRDKKQILFGKEVDLKIEPGVKFNVKIEDIAIPVTTTFVGTEKYEYIQICLPSPYNTIKGKLFAGNRLEFTCIFKGKELNFSSNIIEHLTKPVRAVILEYPKELRIKDLRTSDRVSCRIPSTLTYRGKGKDAIINDISIQGCRLDVVYDPSEKNYIARSSETAEIKCCFPGSAECYNISGIIRSVKKKQLNVSYGVQFSDISQDVQKVIHEYVSENME
ncbi:hypothetical protein MTBBW1_950007 [Desulfamplus magnetovallimortis]|uniref:PilZ domain-containing protein n=1 Tax=Desulfamplus magnetovallimortis TaxID=1246637 RepID=A0A1W1HL54_9BACT|nr:PilZ domain-containing protein [Desulfamplus magnetovallimortis]SLM33209.1 hypothetical protein MTBBW1_950007 [Desulfamplus magnetovallimortis]